MNQYLCFLLYLKSTNSEKVKQFKCKFDFFDFLIQTCMSDLYNIDREYFHKSDIHVCLYMYVCTVSKGEFAIFL